MRASAFWGCRGHRRQPLALRDPKPASLGCRLWLWAAFSGPSLTVPCQPRWAAWQHQLMTVSQTAQFLGFRVCLSPRLSRSSLFGQMIRKRKKTPFWWQKDPWLTGPASPGSWELWYYCSPPKAPSGCHVSPGDPSPSLGSRMHAGGNQQLPVPAEDGDSPVPGFGSEGLGASARHVTCGRCLNNSVSALHTCHWAIRSALSPSLGGKDHERALQTEMRRACFTVIIVERDPCH